MAELTGSRTIPSSGLNLCDFRVIAAQFNFGFVAKRGVCRIILFILRLKKLWFFQRRLNLSRLKRGRRIVDGRDRRPPP